MYEPNRIVTISEMMAILNIGKNTAYKLLRSGKIKAFQLGNKWKIPLESVYNYMNENANRAE